MIHTRACWLAFFAVAGLEETRRAVVSMYWAPEAKER